MPFSSPSHPNPRVLQADAHVSLEGAGRVTRRHSLLAVQTVVVVVLMVVVFVTLLQPESNRPLTGVESPGGQPAGSLPTPNSYTAAGQPGGPGGGGGGAGGPGRGDGGGGGRRRGG